MKKFKQPTNSIIQSIIPICNQNHDTSNAFEIERHIKKPTRDPLVNGSDLNDLETQAQRA